MKLSIHKSALAQAADVVAHAAGRTVGAGAHTGVKLSVRGDQAALTATNGDLTIREVVSVTSGTDGDVVVPARELAQFVRAMPEGVVTLAVENGKVSLTSGKTVMSLPTIHGDSFPQVTFPKGDGVRIEAGAFAAALQQVAPAASDDPARYILTGVLLEATETGLRLVASDSSRLALRDVPGASGLPAGTSIIAPARELVTVAKLIATSGDAMVYLQQSNVTLTTGKRKIMVRLIDGAYPNYGQVLTGAENTIAVVAKGELLAAMNRAKLAASHENVQSVRLAVSSVDGTITVGANQNASTSAVDEVQADLTGESVEFACNPRFFEQALGQIDAEEVKLVVTSNRHPVQIMEAADSPTLRFVVMPVRI